MLVLFSGCRINENSTPTYIITNILPGKEGQMLSLLDENEKAFTTIIGVVNGNFIEVTQGDKIKLKILELNGSMIVSKNIQLFK